MISFLFKLLLILAFIWAVRLLWHLGWHLYWWRKQLQNMAQTGRGNPAAQSWRFVFRGPGGFYRSSSSSSSPDEETTRPAANDPAASGEVIDAQFRVLSEKDDNG